VSKNDANWMYADDFAAETAPIHRARELSREYGIDAISSAVGSQLAVLSASIRAEQIIEIGTGLGVSGLWLLRGSPEAHLTSIDAEYEYHEHAKTLFEEAGVHHTHLRLITGSSSEILPRMNENTYDIVLIDADPVLLLENVEHALRLVRVGGLIVVAHALWHGEVADPSQRGPIPSAFRSVLTLVSESEAVLAALSPAGDGLLQLVRVS
jgi:predicted O-methyltransferase YrrM